MVRGPKCWRIGRVNWRSDLRRLSDHNLSFYRSLGIEIYSWLRDFIGLFSVSTHFFILIQWHERSQELGDFSFPYLHISSLAVLWISSLSYKVMSQEQQLRGSGKWSTGCVPRYWWFGRHLSNFFMGPHSSLGFTFPHIQKAISNSGTALYLQLCGSG